MKIYLDTSVVSMFNNPELGNITREFFDFITQNNHELVISEIVENEIELAEITKREQIISFLKTLNITKLSKNNEIYNLSQEYINNKILTSNHLDDLLHISYATLSYCDVIVSWNRKHIAKESKIQQINLCNLKNNLHTVIICTPQDFLKLFTPFKES
jgi:hypothetical protein